MISLILEFSRPLKLANSLKVSSTLKYSGLKKISKVFKFIYDVYTETLSKWTMKKPV